MARRYVVTSGLTSLAASTTRVACQVATTATTGLIVIAFDVSFDSTATGAGAVPVRVELVTATGASSGGSTFTPGKMYSADVASTTTARINDTTDGSGPVILSSWLVTPTGGFSYQFPLGRELQIANSGFLELRLTSQGGMTTCNYEANLWFEE